MSFVLIRSDIVWIKFLVIILLISLFSGNIGSTNYYVNATTGNDSLAGTSPIFAWKTISKVNAFTFNPGDNIFLERGSLWREQLTISSSGNQENYITFGAYGSGEKPILHGSDIIVGWGNESGDMISGWNFSEGWSVLLNTVINDSDTFTTRSNGYGVMYNDIFEPGKSYRVVINAGSNCVAYMGTNSANRQILGSDGTYNATCVTGQEDLYLRSTLAGITNVVQLEVYSLESTPANVYIKSNLTIQPEVIWLNDSVAHYGLNDTSLNNSQWYWRLNNLYIKDESGNPDTTSTIEAGQRYGIDTNRQSYLNITGIEINRCQSYPLYLRDGENIIVSNLTVDDNHGHAIFISGTDNITVKNNLINNTRGKDRYSGGDGVLVDDGADSPLFVLVDSNIIGGGIDTITRQGIAVVDGDDVIISNNTIEGGLHGIDVEPYTGQVIVNLSIVNNTVNIPANTDSFGGAVNHVGISLNGASGGVISGIVNVSKNYIDLRDEVFGTSASGFSLNNLRNGTIYFENNSIYGSLRGSYVSGNLTTPIFFRYNFIKGGATNHANGIYMTGTNVTKEKLNIDYNIIMDYSYALAFITGGSGGVESNISNNLFHCNGSIYCVMMSDSSHNSIVKNNLFYGTPYAPSNGVYIRSYGPSSTWDMDYNIYEKTGNYFNWQTSTGVNFSTWRSNSSQDSHSLNSFFLPVNNSGYMNVSGDFQLEWNSSAIDSGINVNIDRDYLGNPIYGNPDIGAYEYQPPYNLVLDKINTSVSEGIRVYRNGKFRYMNFSNSNLSANLTVKPVAGFVSNNYSHLVDINITSWNNSLMNWSEYSPNSNFQSAHSVCDLIAGQTYSVYYSKDNVKNLISIYTASSIGCIEFNYLGGYSTVSFDVQPCTVTPSTDSSSSSNAVFRPSENNLGNGYSIKIKETQKVEVTFGEGDKKEVVIESVNGEEVTISVDGKEYVVKEDGNTKIDLDSDGYYDVEVSINGDTVNGYANLKFVLIHEEVPSEIEEENNENIIDKIPEVIKKINWKVYALIGIVIISIILIYIKKRKIL